MNWNLISAVVAGCVFMSGLVFLAVFLIRGVRHRYDPFDEPFSALGFTAESVGGLARRYHGRVGGRDATAFFPPRHRHPSKFNLSARSSHGRCLALGISRPLLTRGGWKRLGEPLAGLRGLKAYSEDPDWARSFLRGEAAALARRLLLEGLGRREQPRELYLRPGEALLRRIPPGSGYNELGAITAEELSAWLEDLCALAALAEAASRP